MTPDFKKKKGNKPWVDIAKNRPFYPAFPLYHLSSMKKVSVSNVLAQAAPTSEFHYSLFEREMKNIITFLSLLGYFSALLGEGTFAYGALIPQSFLCLVNLSSLMNSIFASMWRMRILKKVKFFVWQVLHERVNALDRVPRKVPNLMRWCVAFFAEGLQMGCR